MKNKKIIILIVIVVLGVIGIISNSSESEEIIISEEKYTLLDNGYYVLDGVTYDNEDIDKINDNEYKLDDKNRILKLNFKNNDLQQYFNITYGNDIITKKDVTKITGNKNPSTMINENEYKILDYADENSKLISKVEHNFSSIIDNKPSKMPTNYITYYYNNKNKISKIVSSSVSDDSISETIYTFDYFNYNNKSVVCEKSKSYRNDDIAKQINKRNDGLMKETTTIYYEDDMRKDILSQLGIGHTRLYNKNIIERERNGSFYNYSRYKTDKIIYYKEINNNELVRDKQVEHTYIYNNDDFEGFLEKKETLNTTFSLENKQEDYSIYKKNNKFYYLDTDDQEMIKENIKGFNKDRKDKIELSSDINYAEIYEYDFSNKNEIIINEKLISKDSSLYKEISKFKYDESETNKLIQFVLNSNTEVNIDYKSIDYKKEPIKYLEAYLLGLNKISRDSYMILDEGKISENPNHILYHIMDKTGGTISWYVLDKTNGNIIDYMNDYLEDDDYDIDIDEPIIPDSSNNYIDENIISSMDSQRLRLARNEIYARHGCQFKDKELQAYFESKSWYNNLGYTTGEVEGMLNEIEKANIQTISDYENSY